MTVPLAIVGPPVKAGVSWIARTGHQLTATGSPPWPRPGSGICSLTQNVTLARCGCGSILSTSPTGYAENADVVTGEQAVAVLEVGDHPGLRGAGRMPRYSTARRRDDRSAPGGGQGDTSVARFHLRRPSRRSSVDLPWRSSTFTRRGDQQRRRRRGRQHGDRRTRGRTTRWRGRQRLAVRIARIAGITGDRIGQVQLRLAALAGPRDTAPAAPGCRAGRSCGSTRCDGSSTFGSRPRSENAASTNG